MLSRDLEPRDPKIIGQCENTECGCDITEKDNYLVAKYGYLFCSDDCLLEFAKRLYEVEEI